MSVVDEIISEMRRQYSLVYSWYLRDEFNSVSRLAADNARWQRDNENIRRYLEVVKEMLHPELANPEQIKEVARQVRSGALEFTCGEMADDKDNLYTVAGRIIALYDGLKKQILKEENGNDHSGKIPSSTEYFEMAGDHYCGELQDNDRHLGGRVAIADTNWEVQQLDHQPKMKYRAASDLHFLKLEDEDNLFRFASVDQISIISIQIK